jgi:hypothetical protein
VLVRASLESATKSGRITGSLGETWTAIDLALRRGGRDLPGGSSLPCLLAERPGVRNRLRLPRLTYRQIVAWVDAYHRRTGMWPTDRSGAIPKLRVKAGM